MKAEKARRGDPVPSPKSAGSSGGAPGLAEVADEYDAFKMDVFTLERGGEKFGWELIEWPCARFRAVGGKSARVERRDEDMMDEGGCYDQAENRAQTRRDGSWG